MRRLFRTIRMRAFPVLALCLILGTAMDATAGEKEKETRCNPYLNALEQAGFMSYNSSLSGKIGDMSSKTYGFSKSLSPEKKYFKTGMYIINIEAAISSSDKDKLKENVNLLATALEDESAPLSYLNSLSLISKEISNGTVSFSEARYMFFVLKPILSEFIRSKGKDSMQMCAFGEWTQALSLSMKSVVAEKSSSKINSVIKLGLGAKTFSDDFSKSNLPKGLTTSLKKIQELAAKKDPGQKDAHRVSREIENIINIMTM